MQMSRHVMHFRDLLRASIAAALRYHKDTATEEIDLTAGSLAESVGFGRRARHYDAMNCGLCPSPH